MPEPSPACSCTCPQNVYDCALARIPTTHGLAFCATAVISSSVSLLETFIIVLFSVAAEFSSALSAMYFGVKLSFKRKITPADTTPPRMEHITQHAITADKGNFARFLVLFGFGAKSAVLAYAL